MKSISLVVATVGRVDVLYRLLDSLEEQIRPVDEIIIVDQNRDEILDPVVHEYRHLPILLVKCPPKGANFARNFGFSIASGDIIGFPDDDCWFPDNTLKSIVEAFEERDLDIFSGKVLTDYNGLSSGRWQKDAGPISRDNIWVTTIEFATFFSKSILEKTGGFDVNIGPGSKSIYGAHEIDDLCIRALNITSKTFYDPSVLIAHDEPVTLYNMNTMNRAFRYGAGLGRAIKRHNYPVTVIMNFLIRSLGGVIINLFSKQYGRAGFYCSVFLGRLFGWALSKRSNRSGMPQ